MIYVILTFQQKEDRLRRIHTTIANASFEHIEPHVFTSENTPSSIEERLKKTFSGEKNKKSHKIFI